MMIITKSNTKEVSEHELWLNELRTMWRGDEFSSNVERDLLRGMLERELKKKVPYVASHFFADTSSLTPYERHKLTGDPWKCTFQNTPVGAPAKITMVLMMLILLPAAIAARDVGMIILSAVGWAMMPALAITSIPALNNRYHNWRTARTDVSNVKLYPLSGPVFDRLNTKLSVDDRLRLRGKLISDNSQICSLFMRYYDTAEELIEMIRKIRKSSLPRELRQMMVSQHNEQLDEITDRTLDTVEDIFYSEDMLALEAARKEQEALEAAEQTKAIEAGLNEQFRNNLIITESAGLLAKQI